MEKDIYLLQFLAIQLSHIAGIETLDTIAVSLHDIHFLVIIYLPTFHEDQYDIKSLSSI